MGAPGTSSETGARARVLIIDDHVGSRLAMADLLGDHGYDVDTAEGAYSALHRLEASVPDLVVIGMIMVGVTGLEMTRRVRAQPGLDAVPIIAVSVVDDPKLRTMAFESGADAYLLKPLDPTELLRCIEDLLARARSWEKIPA